jgi:hypothetical protein
MRNGYNWRKASGKHEMDIIGEYWVEIWKWI